MEPMCCDAGAGLHHQELDEARIRLELRMERQRIARLEREGEQRKQLAAAIFEEDMEMIASRLQGQRFFQVPASGKAVVSLPMPKVGETAEQACALCGQLFKEGDRLRMMPCCSHSFHQSCIFKRLSANCVCPCCRCMMPAAEDE